MISMQRVAYEIKHVGLYDLILQDVQKVLKKTTPETDEILAVLDRHPEILRDYKQTNVEYNLSNIHLRDLDCAGLSDEDREKVVTINNNLATLRSLEKYTLDFEHSSTLVLIFSIEFLVLFSAQYFIILLNLKEWQWHIYGFFALSIVVAFFYAKKQQKLYADNADIFEKLYDKTKQLIDSLPVDKTEFFINECEEHI
ncbi:MAG: hypothetical protein CSA21_01425 [Deltaproteobacteria bacterium]|nr:MAG: hypothetical protein CSA21_01425 [Deltaproteobacteria bacterium]